MKKVTELSSAGDWENVKEKHDGATEIIIFKISPICTVSLVAERIFDMWFSQLPDDTKLLGLKIDVIKSRELSQKIAREFEIIHESPQIIWLDKSLNAKWHDSHHRINEKSLKSHLSVSS